jgi:hypothetical protein
MESIDIKVRKNKTEFHTGLYVKALDADEIMDFFDRVSKPSADEASLLAQMVLCSKDGLPVYKPSQVSVVKKKMSGVDWLKLLFLARHMNPVGDLVEFQEKYLKNSESDPVTS